MPIFLLSLLVQVATVIHVVKTGRNTTWIWIIVMLPLAGSLAYFFIEVLPGLGNTRTGRSASRKVSQLVNPDRDFNDAAKQYAISDTVESRMRLAEECLNKDKFDEAKSLYEKCLTGPHRDDPYLMYGLAQAEFGLGNAERVKYLMDDLIAANPDFKNQDAHLLYARALEAMGKLSDAMHEYETLHEYFVGPLASFYFGCFLKSQNVDDRAQKVFSGILEKADLAGQAYKTLHAEVLKKTRQQMH